MKIGIAGLSHETVTTLPGFTGEDSFENDCKRGEEVIVSARGSKSSLGGIVDFCERNKVQLYPILDADGGVSATVLDEVYLKYKKEIVSGFKEIFPELDGILLSLHGAMATETIQDPELDLIKGIREVVGYDIPIMAALDLHANIDSAIFEEANVIFGFKSSPHIDKTETGSKVASCMLDFLKGKINPVTAIVKPGLVVPSVFSATGRVPAKYIVERAKKYQENPDVLDVTVFFGFAYADVYNIGLSVVVTTDGNIKLAEEIAQDLGNFAYGHRIGLTTSDNLYKVEEGVAFSIAQAKKASRPIIILDHADRTGDTTFVLQELIKQDAQRVAFPLFYDPEAVQHCIKAGVGNEVEVEVGGKSHFRAGEPVIVKGKVIWVGNKEYIGTGPMRLGSKIKLGPTAIIQAGGVWLQLTTNRKSLIDGDPIIQFGYDPLEFDIIVTKSKTHFRAVYEDLGEEIVIIDAPGSGPADLGVLEYKNVPPDVYPITKKPEEKIV